MHTILFICTGNTCRSPMAEAIAQKWIDDGGLGSEDRYLAASAGVAATAGSPPAHEAVAALAARGIEIDGRSKPLTAPMIRAAHVIFCFTASHLSAAQELVAGEKDQIRKLHLLDPEGDVSDPIGRGRDAYDALVKQFLTLIPRRLTEVLHHEDRAGLGSSRT